LNSASLTDTIQQINNHFDRGANFMSRLPDHGRWYEGK